MRKKTWTGICLLLLCLLAACGKKEAAQSNTKEQVYESEVLSPEGVEGVVTEFAVTEDAIYLSVSGWETTLDDTSDPNQRRLYKTTLSGDDAQEIALPEGTAELTLVRGSATALIQTEAERYLLLDAETGTETDVTDVLSVGDGESVLCAIAGENQTVTVATTKRFLVLNGDGTLRGEAEATDGYVECVARAKDGSVLATQTKEDRVTVRRLDTDSCKWKKAAVIETKLTIGGDVIIDGATYDFYYRDDTGIYGYSMEDGQGTKLLDYTASAIDTTYAYSIAPVDDTHMLGFGDYRQENAEMTLYTKVDAQDVTERVVLTYGSEYVDERIRTAVTTFNRENRQYQIQLREYSTDETGQDSLAADLASGNAPDLIDLRGQSVEQYAEKGILEDLAPYMEQGDGFGASDLLPTVAEAMQTNGTYYYVSPAFRIATVIASAKDVEGQEGMTLSEMIRFSEAHPEQKLFDRGAPEDTFNLLLAHAIGDFVDWDTGECSFDGAQFREILEFAGTQTEDMTEEDGTQEEERIRDGKTLLAATTVCAEDVELYRLMFGGDIAFIGYPNAERNGSLFVFQNCVGISAQSEHKDGAWEFLQLLMSAEYQGKPRDPGLVDVGAPTRQDAFEMYLCARTTTESYRDSFGNLVSPMDFVRGFSDYELQLGPISGEEAQQFRDLVARTNTADNSDDAIFDIIMEESEAYFQGDKTLDETVKIMQDRATKYVNENR